MSSEEPTPGVVAPPMPAEPPRIVPAVPAVPAAPVRKDRRVLRAVLRWTAAAVVFAAVGTATAYGITGMERTDVPGLATESDGRWDYPELTRPPLPSGSPAAFADSNSAASHHADLRELVLPAPEGATQDPKLRGRDGWLPVAEFVDLFEADTDREDITYVLRDYGVRHIAARGWTMPDGTRGRVYLLRFDTAAVADEVYAQELFLSGSPRYEVRGVDVGSLPDGGFKPPKALYDLEIQAFDEAKPYGRERVRQAYISAGDVLAVIVLSGKDGVAEIPFQQTVVLQGQLLG
ncbi:hypothetical protein [Streptomyces flavalbus]|uniref:Uncharacterized protein n=1 Tax=Streptomyces flavalbus TaxID=2665155 RepID=A0ABW2W8P1_9ACTN